MKFFGVILFTIELDFWALNRTKFVLFYFFGSRYISLGLKRYQFTNSFSPAVSKLSFNTTASYSELKLCTENLLKCKTWLTSKVVLTYYEVVLLRFVLSCYINNLFAILRTYYQSLFWFLSFPSVALRIDIFFYFFTPFQVSNEWC